MKNKIIVGIVTVLIAIASWLMGFTGTPTLSGGKATAVADIATTTSAGSATFSPLACLTHCVLGNVSVIKPATAGYLRIWNATSTATSTYQDTTHVGAPGIVGIPVANILSASDVVGTLHFDTFMQHGIVIEASSAFDGEYVISWKK